MKKQFGLLTVGLALAWAGTAQAANANAPTTACKSIADVFAKDPQFSTLYTSLRASGLINTLGNQGSYTLFAPNNAAFSKIPPQQLAAILGDQQALKNLLLYHVVPEKASMQQIRGSASGITMQGSPVMVGNQSSVPTINDARIIKADVAVCNGMVHTVDAVLLPATLTSQAGIKTPRTGNTPLASAPIAARPQSPTPAPPVPVMTRPAAAVPAPQAPLPAVTPRPVPAPASGRPINRKPVLDAKNVLSAQQASATTGAEEMSFDVSRIPALPLRELANKGTSTVSVPSNQRAATATYTHNGTLQSKVALKTQVVRVSGENIAELLGQDPRFSVLRELLLKTGLLDTLSMEMGEYTLFAPTNKAFAKLDKKTLALLAADPIKLKAALMYHIVSGRPSFESRRSVPVTTVESSSLMVARDSGRLRLGSVTSDGGAINAKNGDVYAIDAVLIPPTVRRN